MKKTNGQITTAKTNASGDVEKMAIALGVSVQWLRATMARRGL